MVEFIHTATLLHDDVVDESELRRGRRTANAVFGNAASVLVGDFLYSRAFQMMVGVRSMRVMEVLADATNTIAEGEVMQLLNVPQRRRRRGGLPGGDSPQDREALRGRRAAGGDPRRRIARDRGRLRRLRRHLGTAFQLVDDVLDYSGDLHETGKNLGDDLNEGKPTLPLIHVMRRGTPAQTAPCGGRSRRAGATTFARVLDAIRASGALDYARAAARARSGSPLRRARRRAGDSAYKQSLLDLAAFAVERNY